MDFTGRIISILPARQGVSRNGNNWMSQEYVIEDASNGQFPRKMVFDVFGEDKIQQFNIKVGEDLTVSFDIDARQWNDRWFNSIRAWKVTRATEQAQPASAPVQPQVAQPIDPFPNTANEDDLPF